MPSRYQNHVERWSECMDCNLCFKRKNTVLVRGRLPADVLFIGEAPGKSEDVCGVPFIGKAGKLLDRIIEASEIRYCRLAFTNLVACIPLQSAGEKLPQPKKEQILACRERLLEIIDIASPELIVNVGSLATKQVAQLKLAINMVDIIHPSAILQTTPAEAALAIRRTQILLDDAAESFVPF